MAVMTLPVYQTIHIRSAALDDLQSVLSGELNLKHPLVLDMKTLTVDEQRELIGLIENHFVMVGISYKFPYPVYVITDHESTISGLPLVKTQDELPKFFQQKDGKTNIKEQHLIARNKLLQQEVRNGDNMTNETEIKVFGKIHRHIFLQEEERLFCRTLLNKLTKVKRNG